MLDAKVRSALRRTDVVLTTIVGCYIQHKFPISKLWNQQQVAADLTPRIGKWTLKRRCAIAEFTLHAMLLKNTPV
jgi:hypothetical protein